MEKQQIAKYVCGAASISLSVIGFGLGQSGYVILKEILTGVGLNVGSSLFQEQLAYLQSRIAGEEGMLNHDIQKAWIRAAITASKTIETQYFDSQHEQALPKNEEAAIRSFFEDVRAQLNDRFAGGQKRITLSSETLERLQADGCPEHLVAALRPIRRSFANETDLLDALKKRLAPDDFNMYQQQIVAHAVSITLPFTTDEVQLYLDGGRQQAGDTLSDRLNLPELLQDYPPDFTQFFEANFLPQIQFFFKEELKKDAPENNKAWRAFQMMLLYGLRDDIATLRADQQAQFEKLHEAIANLERQPAEERSHEPYWDRVLSELSAFAEKALQGIHVMIATQHVMIATQAEHTGRLTELTGGQRVNHQELAELRQDATTIKEIDSRIEGRVIGMEQGVRQVDERVQHLAYDVRSILQQIYAMLKNGGRLEDGAPPIAVARAAQFGHLFAEYTRLFAGREPELQSIREFLTRRQQRYACISAGPGFGKTALLANLIHESPNRYCYHFFNRSYATHTAMSFLRNLCEQLCQYYRIGGTLPHEPEQLYALYWQLLMLDEIDPAKPLILVFDGMDEAEDYFATHPIIPPRLPQGKYIIFSARGTCDDWLARLGLPVQETLPIPLEGLDAVGIQRLLQQAGGQAVAFADNPELLAELRQVSRGDPFYLRFLVEDIVAGRITADNLLQMPSRAEEYFQQQFKQLWDSVTEEDQTIAQWQDAVLQFLFVADKGRLSRDDLIDLAGIKEQQFEKTMRPISRFLNEENDRYVFCHPRFRAYFSGRMPRANKRPHADLLAYCARWPEHRSSYVLQYYPEHLLDDSGQHETLFSLARNVAFRQAQLAVFPETPELSLRVFQSALQAAMNDDDPVKMAEFLLAYRQQVLDLQALENPLEALRRTNNLARSWALADLHDPEERLHWYLLLIWELHEAQRQADAHTTLERLRQKPLPCIWKYLRKPLDPAETVHTLLLMPIYEVNEKGFWEICRHVFADANCYISLCDALVKKGYFTAAVHAAQYIPDNAQQGEKLRQIAQEQAKSGNSAEARTTCLLARKAFERIQDIEQRIKACQELALTQFDAGDQHGAQETLMVASDIVQNSITEAELRAAMLNDITAVQMKIGDHIGAKRTLAAMKKAVLDVEIRSGYWVRVERQGDVDKSEKETGLIRVKTISLTHPSLYRAEKLSAISIAQTQAGDLDDARETLTEAKTAAQENLEPQELAVALGTVAAAQIRTGQKDSARETIVEAQAAIQKIEEAWSKIGTLGKIAEELAKAGDNIIAPELCAMALSMVREIEAKADSSKTALPNEESLWRKYLPRKFSRVRPENESPDDHEQDKKALRKAEELSTIAAAQILFGDLSGAREILTKASIAVSHLQGNWVTFLPESIAKKQVQSGDLAGAVSTAQRFNDSWKKSEVQKAIVTAQLENNDIRGALLTTQTVEDIRAQIEALQTITSLSLNNEERRKAQEIIHALLEKIHHTKDVTLESEALSKIAVIQAQIGDVPGALASAEKMWDSSQRLFILKEIASVRKKANDHVGMQKTLETAVTVALIALKENKKRYDFLNDSSLDEVAILQAKMGEITGALVSAQKIKSVANRSQIMQRVAVIQTLNDDTRNARETVAKAWSQRSETSSNDGKERVLQEIANLTKQDTDTREDLDECAIDLAQHGDITASLKASEKIRDKIERIGVLCQIVALQKQRGDESNSRKTLKIAEKIVMREKFLRKWIGKLQLDRWLPTRTLRQVERRGHLLRWFIQGRFLEWLIRVQQQNGDIRKALEFVRSIEDLYHYQIYSRMQIPKGDYVSAQEILKMVLTAVPQQSLYRHPEWKLETIAIIQAEMGDIENAKATTKAIVYIDRRAETLGMIAAVQAKQGNKDAAKATIQEIETEEGRQEALVTLAVALAETGDIVEAATLAQDIKEPEDQATIYANIALKHAQNGNTSAAHTAFATALSFAQTIASAEQQAYTLNAIAAFQARAGLADDALRTLELLPVKHERYWPSLAAVFAENGDKDHFKRLLLPCAGYVDAAYAMCGHLARLYPEQASAIAEVLLKQEALDKKSEV